MKFTKQTLKRMLRTFLQAAIGFMATTGITMLTKTDTDFTENIHCTLIGSALASGLAAVMNLEKNQKDDNNTFQEQSSTSLNKE